MTLISLQQKLTRSIYGDSHPLSGTKAHMKLNASALTELLSVINADLIKGQGLYAQRLRWCLRDCETPEFTLNQAWYWVCNDYHSGQYSPGYQRFCQASKNYKPSMSESSAELAETDSDFDVIYSHFVDRYEEGCLYL